MRHLDRKDLLPEFRKRLAEAETVDIAVAWATMCPALESLLERARKFKPKARVIVGISGNATRPLALQELQKKVDLRVTSGEVGLFHPKFYLFKGGKKSVCWTGSANLTDGGFGRNDELVHEFNDKGYAQDWFDILFKSLGKNSKKEIADYILKWRPPRNPEPRSITAVPSRGHPISLLQRKAPTDWSSYFEALNRCDAYWHKNIGHFSVLDEVDSYLNTITDRIAPSRSTMDQVSGCPLFPVCHTAHSPLKKITHDYSNGFMSDLGIKPPSQTMKSRRGFGQCGRPSSTASYTVTKASNGSFQVHSLELFSIDVKTEEILTADVRFGSVTDVHCFTSKGPLCDWKRTLGCVLKLIVCRRPRSRHLVPIMGCYRKLELKNGC